MFTRILPKEILLNLMGITCLSSGHDQCQESFERYAPWQGRSYASGNHDIAMICHDTIMILWYTAMPYIIFEQTLPKFADVPSFPWTRLLTCPVLNPFSPISRYSVSSLVNRIVNRWSTVDRWIASIFGQWSTGFNDDHTKQNSELDIWIHQWPVHLLQLNSVSRGAQSVQLSLHMSLLKRGKWNQQMQTS